jgi:uncharacterized protein (UPF0264 family)
MSGFLASVASLEEMEMARAGGADIVDLKNPAKGALGAWEPGQLAAAVARWRRWPGPRPLLSATIGDQPMRPATLVAAAEEVAACGAPLVKLGMFPGGDTAGCLAALRPLARRTQLIAVFFGDQEPPFDLLSAVAAAGFYGAMIDTADKAAGGLRLHLNPAELADFVRRARALGMVVGLAGSLKLEDVAPLAALEPDYLGFRGALCAGGRAGRLDAGALAQVAGAVKAARRAA